MYPLFETIRIQNRQIINAEYHDQRIRYSTDTLFGSTANWKVNEIINIPKELDNEIFKCRLEYNENSFEYRFERYEYRKITSLKLVYDDQIKYDLKYTDRSCFDRLKTGCNPDQDILIVRNGLITDTSFSNVCLWNGAKWLTPKTPLLKGTMRQKLLDDNIVEMADIQLNNLMRFKRIVLINAMMDLEKGISIRTDFIFE